MKTTQVFKTLKPPLQNKTKKKKKEHKKTPSSSSCRKSRFLSKQENEI